MRLQDIINNLMSSHPPAAPIHAKTETEPSDAKAATLIIPEAPEMLDESNYLGVPYWYETDWLGDSGQQRDGAKSISKLNFLTDKNGRPVMELWIKEFTMQAKQLWNELYCHCLDPSLWTKKTLTAASYFINKMR